MINHLPVEIAPHTRIPIDLNAVLFVSSVVRLCVVCNKNDGLALLVTTKLYCSSIPPSSHLWYPTSVPSVHSQLSSWLAEKPIQDGSFLIKFVTNEFSASEWIDTRVPLMLWQLSLASNQSPKCSQSEIPHTAIIHISSPQVYTILWSYKNDQ